MSEEIVYEYLKQCLSRGNQPGSHADIGRALGMRPDTVSTYIQGLKSDHSIIVTYPGGRYKPSHYEIPGVTPAEWPQPETGLSVKDPFMTQEEYRKNIFETQKEMRRLFMEGYTFEQIQDLVPNFIDDGRWSWYSVVQTITGSPDPRIQQFIKERWPTAR